MRSVTVKVADFGIVREYGEGELGTTGVGTVAYMSPERLHVEEGVGYSFVADVWAVGLIAGECAQGRHLYPDEVQTVTTNGNIFLRAPSPKSFSREASHFEPTN